MSLTLMQVMIRPALEELGSGQDGIDAEAHVGAAHPQTIAE